MIKIMKKEISLGLISSDELNAICKMRSINPRREFFNSELNLVLSNYLSKENHKVFEKK